MVMDTDNLVTVAVAAPEPESKKPRKGGAAGVIEMDAMENCRRLESLLYAAATVTNSDKQVTSMFDCKTCGRKFESFQALGGHRTSHKKAKLKNYTSEFILEKPNAKVAKPTTHKCKFCGEECPTGQALGGHMSKHRDVFGNSKESNKKKRTMAKMSDVSNVTSEGSSGNSDANNNGRDDRKQEVKPVSSSNNWGLSLWWSEEQLQEYNNSLK